MCKQNLMYACLFVHVALEWQKSNTQRHTEMEGREARISVIQTFLYHSMGTMNKSVRDI